jgi:hypothetical protein
MLRRLSAAAAALVLALLLAAPAFAGGWADIVVDAQTVEPPVAGEPVVVGFKVMQHGETPAGWESPTVHFTNLSTGRTIDVAATSDGADGHFGATASLPEAGYWTWQVTLRDLASDHLPVGLAVRTAAGDVPAYDPASIAVAIARAQQETMDAMSAQIYPEIERLDRLVVAQQSKADRALEQANAITDERDTLALRLAEAESGGGLPILAVVTLAVLAGATAGFAMAWLAGRPGPSVSFNPVPREADRA